MSIALLFKCFLPPGSLMLAVTSARPKSAATLLMPFALCSE